MSTNCKENEFDIILYTENELPEADMLRLEAHFAQCPGCRRVLDRQRLIRSALRHAATLKVPEDFTRNVMAAVPSPFRSFLSTARDKILAAAAAILLGAVSLGFFILGASGVGGESAGMAARFNSLVVEGFRLVANTLLFVIAFARVMLNVGSFLLGQVWFVLTSSARMLLVTPSGRMLLLVCALSILGAVALFVRRWAHAHAGGSRGGK